MYSKLIDVFEGLHFMDTDCPIFFTEVMREVHRVLKPGGIHIMQNEMSIYHPHKLFMYRPFTGLHFYPPEILEVYFLLDYIAILQKEN